MPASLINVPSFTVRLRFQEDLKFFLKGREATSVARGLKEKTSVKDIIESCGIPHTEVDLIIVDGEPVNFRHLINGPGEIEVYSVGWKRDTHFTENRLQSIAIKSFVADGHLGKLVRHLRLLGLDVLYDPPADDARLLQLAQLENRALLTRDRRLLMHAALRHGYYLRSQDAIVQTGEVLRRFQLASAVAPFTRCIRCNSLLEPVKKAKVIEQLQPLTKMYYQDFRRCLGCGQIYWPGSHFKKLQGRLARLLET